jgi:hypothetical protein
LHSFSQSEAGKIEKRGDAIQIGVR